MCCATAWKDIPSLKDESVETWKNVYCWLGFWDETKSIQQSWIKVELQRHYNMAPSVFTLQIVFTPVAFAVAPLLPSSFFCCYFILYLPRLDFHIFFNVYGGQVVSTATLSLVWILHRQRAFLCGLNKIYPCSIGDSKSPWGVCESQWCVCLLMDLWPVQGVLYAFSLCGAEEKGSSKPPATSLRHKTGTIMDEWVFIDWSGQATSADLLELCSNYQHWSISLY